MVQQIRFLIILIFASCLSLKTWAKVDIQNTQRLILPTDASEPVMSAETSQKILPKTVEQGESGSTVISQIFDNSLSFWWENSPAKNTSLGQVADKVDKNLKTEVNFGKSEDQKTEHKISVKLLAMQALAKIQYSGWVQAAINYDAKAAKTEAEVLENLSNNKDLVVSHTVTSIEKTSAVSIRWNW